jgi:hypothetical protein
VNAGREGASVTTFVLILVLGASSGLAQGIAPASQLAPATTTASVTNVTRVEAWNYFTPKPEGGDPSYAFVSNRLRFGIRHVSPRFELQATGQYVQFGGLPTNATGPGPYGTGALYFGQNGSTSSNQLYLRYLTASVKDLVPGLRIDVGRMGYSGGMESSSGNDKIETLKNLRVAARLLGEFEWSAYQRGYDGVRLDYSQPTWHASAVAYHPTQGGFEEAAGVQIVDINVFAGTLTLKPGAAIPNTDTQLFYYRYDDRREVRARVDNTGLPAADRVDVKLDTFGATAVGAYPRGSGVSDALLWVVGQTGEWYGQTHRGFAIAAEGGYQWSEVAWRPWIRLGVFRGSGDADPADDRHDTFFQLLPTVRKYSLTASYNLMNSTDIFVQVLLQPRPPLNLRIDLHRVGLAEAADRWYLGAGATQRRGTTFGYGARPSNDSTDLGTVIEGSASYQVNAWWSVNAFLGLIHAGGAVRGSFDGDTLRFGYVESVVSFDALKLPRGRGGKES